MRPNLRRLMKPALLLSFLGLVMTIDSIVRSRHYVHGRYTDPRIWQLDPFGSAEAFIGPSFIALGFWLFFAESDLDDGDDDNPRSSGK